MLKTRVMTAAVLLAGFVSALYLLPRNGWVAFCALFLGLSAWEWGALAALAAVGRLIYSTFLVGFFVLPGILEASAANGPYAPAWVYLVAGLFWIVLVPAFAAMVDLRSIHPSLLIAVLGTVWISDTAAYFAGRRFGQRKLAPSISPGKTWEGAAGALAAVAVYALAWAGLSAPGTTPAWPGAMRVASTWILPVLLGLAVVGMIGDLFESLIKRQAGVKDS